MQAEFTTGQIRPIECVKEGWAVIKDDYWLLFGLSIVGAFIGGLSFYVLIGAMICGIFRCYLNKIDGLPVKFDDLWSGFGYFWKSLPLTLIVVTPIVIYLAAAFTTVYLPLLMVAVGGSKVQENELFTAVGIAFAVDLVIAVVMIFLHSLVIFSFPLLVDRGMSSWPAIKLSARAVLRNLGGVGGMIAMNFLLVLCGELALCVGIYLVIPIITAANLIAYRQVFPRMTFNTAPPPPDAYLDLSPA